jgi:hypothetical protein
MLKVIKMLGHHAEDRVTGFGGVITAVSFEIGGTVSIRLGEEQWFDGLRIRVLSDDPIIPAPDFGVYLGPSPAPAKE